MGKTLGPLDRLSRYEGWLLLAAAIGVIGGLTVLAMAPPVGWVLIPLGVVALLAALIAYPIRLAATAIVDASKARSVR